MGETPIFFIPMLERFEIDFDNKKILNNDSTILIYENCIDNNTCDYLTEVLDTRNLQKRKMDHFDINYDVYMFDKENESEISVILNLILTESFNEYLVSVDFMEYFNTAESFGTKIFEGFKSSKFHYKKYFCGDRYGWHHDGPIPNVISTVMYLNDDYEGGELLFKNQNAEYKPKKGDVIYFPSTWSYIHKSNPVTKGEKKIIGSWFSAIIRTEE